LFVASNSAYDAFARIPAWISTRERQTPGGRNNFSVAGRMVTPFAIRRLIFCRWTPPRLIRLPTGCSRRYSDLVTDTGPGIPPMGPFGDRHGVCARPLARFVGGAAHRPSSAVAAVWLRVGGPATVPLRRFGDGRTRRIARFQTAAFHSRSHVRAESTDP